MTNAEDLPFGPLDARALHICIDMQRIFLEPGPWYGEACLSVVEPQRKLIAHAPGRSLFTRFITAHSVDDASGCWRQYYRHWQAITQDEAGAAILDICEELSPLAHEGNVYDKIGHDAFKSEEFCKRIVREKPGTLILSGIETDVCVLATAMSAIDLGYRTIIATDAVASSVAESHTATLAHIYPRFDQQVELASVDTIIRCWSLS